MKPFFNIKSNKSREIKEIKKYIPSYYDIFVDVFSGNGSILLSLLPNDVNHHETFHYNDINSVYCSIYRKLLIRDESFINELKNIKITNELCDNLRKENYCNINDICKYLLLNKICLKGLIDIKSYDLRDCLNKNLFDIYHPLEYMEKISIFKNDLTITNKDYKEIFKQYKYNPNAFLYLDPPNIELSSIFFINDIEFIYSFMKECMCKVMLNIDYNGYTREKFNEFFKYCYFKKCKIINDKKNSAKIYNHYYLIATNYDKYKNV